jgi:ATP-dependent DNA helicase DinG
MTEKKTEKKTEKRLPTIKGDFDFRPSFVLGKDGPLAKGAANYQVRQPQILLAEQIQLAFEEKKHLIAEAATGTGKSFSCLLAAIKKSVETQTPVVISTHTISLQEQLYEKDAPYLLDKLNLKSVKVVLAKGRGNYVSRRRARIVIKERRPGYTKLDKWLKSTTDGTSASINFKLDNLTWRRARSDSDQCLGEGCPKFADCFYQKSRREINKAHIIIANHNLVLLDLKMKRSGIKGILPDYKCVIFDEAHEVENVARQVLTFELRQKDISLIFNEIYDEEKRRGFLNSLEKVGTASLFKNQVEEDDDIKGPIINESVKCIKDLLKENDEFFRKVGAFIGTYPMKRFVEPESVKTELLGRITSTLEALKDLEKIVDDKNKKTAIEYASKKCTEIAEGIATILTLPNVEGKDYPEVAAWAAARTMPGGGRAYSVVSAPIFLKSFMRKLVFNPLDSVVLTSATLTTGGMKPFKMIEGNLGVFKPMKVRLPSVFNYEKQVFVIVIEDMPEQKETNYASELAKQVKKYARVGGGGTFVLFTSFKVMNSVYDDIKVSLEMSGHKVFCQGKGMGRSQMVQEFKRAKKGILFGVSSFWTGVDIPGKALQKLIITKLPFPAPSDPLMQAQEEIYKKFKRNFFMEKSLPMTAIMLKQGFGRLIRTNKDKGMVVILDSRVVTKKYGAMLLGALPSNCPIKRGRRDSKLS